MSAEVRVRFAPSPTGELHIGGVRTALFNWLYARHNKGSFILRIEDTDARRSTEESARQIVSAMKWVGLNWDEGPETGGKYGPYFQSERSEFYQQAVEYLLENDRAYYCYCSPGEIDQLKKEAEKEGQPLAYPGRCRNLSPEEKEAYEKEGRKPVIRLKTPDGGYTVVQDLIRGEVSFENRLLEDFIIVKSDGNPTYNFACVVDDNAMQVSHVIRAEEHLSNTPKQVMIYQALDYRLPEFAHVPMILAPDRSKLSKRHGATSVDEFRKDGYLPEALINYLFLLGWYPGNDDEILPLEEAVRRFDFDGVSSNPAIYDTEKLSWVNGYYMRELPLDRVMDYALPFIREAGYLADEPTAAELNRLEKIVDAVRGRSRTLVELTDGISYFYDDQYDYDPKGVKKHFRKDDTTTVLENDMDCLKRVEPFEREVIEVLYRERSEELGVKAARMIHTTRLALSGRTYGPGLFTLVELLGREESIRRLQQAVDYVQNLED